MKLRVSKFKMFFSDAGHEVLDAVVTEIIIKCKHLTINNQQKISQIYFAEKITFYFINR